MYKKLVVKYKRLTFKSNIKGYPAYEDIVAKEHKYCTADYENKAVLIKTNRGKLCAIYSIENILSVEYE